jgi:phosphoglycolate phosphatase
VFEGVIWKGDKLIEGVPETLDMLRAKVGKRISCSIYFKV